MFTSRAPISRVTVPLFVVLVLASSSQLHAQFVPDGNTQNFSKQLKTAVEAQKKAAENRMDSRIADIDRACQLSESQKQKLSVAAKGAVKEHIRKMNRLMVNRAKELGVEFDANADTDAEPENNEEGEGNVQQNDWEAMMIQEIVFMTMLKGGSAGTENSKVWKSAVEKVLDEEQTKKWDDWQKERTAFQRRVAVEQFVAKADRKLLLSPEQRTQLTAYVDGQHGKKLCDEAIANDVNQFGMNVWMGAAMGGGEQPDTAEADEALKKILSDSQLQEWQKTFAPQFGGMGGGGDFGAFDLIGGAMAVEGDEIGGIIEEEGGDDDK